MKMNVGVVGKKEGDVFQRLGGIAGTINGNENFFFHGWLAGECLWGCQKVIFIFLSFILIIMLLGALPVRVFLRLLACVFVLISLFYGLLAAKVNGKEWPAGALTVVSRYEMNGDNGFQLRVFSENMRN